MFSFPPSQPSEFRSSNIFSAAAAAAAASADSRNPPNHHHRNWERSAGGCSTNSGDDESDEDDVDDEEDEDDDGHDGGDGDQNDNNHNNSININNKSNSGNETVNNAGSGNPEKMGNGKAKPSFVGGSCRESVVKEGGIGQGVREGNNYQNAVTIADPDGDIYYTQFLQGGEGSAASGGGNAQKDILVENCGGYGFSGRKDVPFFSESGESLRAILSDPVTGALMDDAMILPCGHSFGAAGIQHVLRMLSELRCRHFVGKKSYSSTAHLKGGEKDLNRIRVAMANQISWIRQGVGVSSFHLL
ncbi:hypothetical protein ES288_A05G451200v1 [Gossypium darwinii]|uniref:U-box domain-containing protein n=1 Tax=Gossypium darwinii TaxID=34276 RepID=A0A5D2GSZ3_GOSDA|nr:hypothetical protein ES288_A05G451200v1 [Gossypium darwinii]